MMHETLSEKKKKHMLPQIPWSLVSFKSILHTFVWHDTKYGMAWNQVIKPIPSMPIVLCAFQLVVCTIKA